MLLITGAFGTLGWLFRRELDENKDDIKNLKDDMKEVQSDVAVNKAKDEATRELIETKFESHKKLIEEKFENLIRIINTSNK